MHPLPLLLSLAVVGVACRAGPRVPGARFAGAELLAPVSAAEEAHDGLMHADVTRADSVARFGYRGGLATVLANDAVFLRDGLPILHGAAAALAVAAAESIGAGTAVRWQPVRVEASADGRSGYSYGYTIRSTGREPAPAVRVDRYIAWWRRTALGWRIAAYAETYGAPPPPLLLPPAAAASVMPDVPMRAMRGALEAMRSADTAFSREARRNGAGAAFGRFAAEDAQMFSVPGELLFGPEAIVRSFGPPTEGSELTWYPVAGEVSAAGDLGVTVGNAVSRVRRDDGTSEIRFSKYLTVWKKQRDGTWRYVVDGGSARPQR